MDDSVKVEMNDPVDPIPQEEELNVTAGPTPLRTKFTGKEVWNALEVVQKRHKKYLVPVLLKLQKVPTSVFELLEGGGALAGELGLTDADVAFVVAVINYCQSPE